MRNIYEFISQEVGSDRVFLGGSRRFGYDTSESDWDIFVLDNDAYEVTEWLRDASATPVDTEIPTTRLYDQNSMRFLFGSADIHVFSDHVPFTRLASMHDKVAAYVAENNLVPGIRIAKKAHLGYYSVYRAGDGPSFGSRIYRQIEAAVKDAEWEAGRAEREAEAERKAAEWDLNSRATLGEFLSRIPVNEQAEWGQRGRDDKILAIRDFRYRYGGVGLATGKAIIERMMEENEQ